MVLGNGIVEGTQGIERARESMAVLLNDMLHTAVTDFGCVSSKILCVKLKFSMVKVCVVVLG